MLLVRFESFTRFALALPASWALAAAVGATTPVFAVVLTTFLTGSKAGAVLATAARLAVRLAAVLTKVFLVAAVLTADLLAAGLAVADLTAVALAAGALGEAALAALFKVFFTPWSSVRAACRETLALAVRCLGVSLLGAAVTVVVAEAFTNWAS